MTSAPLPAASTPSPTPADAAPAFQDQRRFARKACKLPARLTIVDAWDPACAKNCQCDIIVRNISRTGAAFLYFRQLYPDDRLTIEFGELLRHYRVARCRRLDKNCYEIGVAICAAPDRAD